MTPNKEYFEKQMRLLERIADAQEARLKDQLEYTKMIKTLAQTEKMTDEKGVELATEMIQMIKVMTGMPMKIDVPIVDPQADDVLEARDVDIDCLKCGHGYGVRIMNPGEADTFFCKGCQEAWPEDDGSVPVFTKDDPYSLEDERAGIFDDMEGRCEISSCDHCEIKNVKVVWHEKTRWCRECYIYGGPAPRGSL